MIGVRDLPPLICPFDPGYDPATLEGHLEQSAHLMASLKIDDRYATYRIVLNDDTVVTGVVVEEKDGVVKVIENPLASAKPREIKATDIVLLRR